MVQEVLLGIMGFIGLWQSLLYALPEVVVNNRSERQKGTRDMSYYSASPRSANELRWSCLKM